MFLFINAWHHNMNSYYFQVTALSNIEAKKRYELLEAVSGTMDAHLRYFKQVMNMMVFYLIFHHIYKWLDSFCGHFRDMSYCIRWSHISTRFLYMIYLLIIIVLFICFCIFCQRSMLLRKIHVLYYDLHCGPSSTFIKLLMILKSIHVVENTFHSKEVKQ